MLSGHQIFMDECQLLAHQAKANGESPVGSVVVHDGIIIGKGVESVKSDNDVTRHAEILAIRDALKSGHGHLLSASTLYSTHEPCCMCSYPIRYYKIREVVFAKRVAHIGGATSRYSLLRTSDIPQWGDSPEIIILDTDV